MEFSFWDEFEIKVKVNSFYPGRSAPHCSNPDNPAYADPGDDPEADYELFFLIEQEKWNKEKRKYEKIKIEVPLPEELYIYLEEIVFEKIKEKYENEHE